MLTASALTKQCRPRENGAADGSRDFPGENAPSISSETEQQIQALCEEDSADEYRKLVRKLAAFRGQIASVREALPSDIGSIANSVKTAQTTVLMEHAADIGSAAAEVERRAKDVRQFKLLNDLNREPSYTASKIDLIGTLIFFVMIESAINAYLFGQASDAGFAGGFITAGMVSLINVAMGFFLGVLPFRQANHVKKWRLLFAIPMIVVLIPAGAIFNLIVGYYRDALQQNPDQQLLDIVPAAMRHLGEVQSLESLVLIIAGILVFLLSGYKGYAVWDTYPGYMSKHEALKQAEAELKARRVLANVSVEKNLSEQFEKFKSLGLALVACRKSVETIGQRIDADRALTEANIDQTEGAGQTAIQVYRQANLKVRNPRLLPPRYFQNPFKLDRGEKPQELRLASDEVLSLSNEIKKLDLAFQEAQEQILSERLAIMTRLEETISRAERDAKAQVREEQQKEVLEREALRGSRDVTA